MKLEIKDLSKKFDKHEVLSDINFTFESGKIYGLLGKNGSGKTTFFNCLNGDLKAESGTFSLITNEGSSKKITADDIGYVLSTPVVPDFLTAYEFLKFFLDINHDRITDIKPIDEYFSMISIEEKDRYKLLKNYSHGMKNKIQMLINIIANPAVLLLDEPLTSFDIVAAEEMKNLLRDIKKDCILIFSTHILELALDLCDEIVLLNDKKLTLISGDVKADGDLKEKIISSLRGSEDDSNN